MSPEDIGLYIHWPFCESKCAYCDFNSHVRDEVDQARWRRALLAELAHEAALTPGRRLASIFFGGGTPSLMPPETVASLIDAARAHWPSADDLEITLEANPSSAEAARFAGYAQAGVNRLSLGIQSLDDAVLRFLTRRHDAREARSAIALAQQHFSRASFDLIYARPNQSVAQWLAELDEALAFGTRHLSLYQLTIEPNTGFAGAYRRGAFALPDEETGAALFEATHERMMRHGLPRYEVSNHAVPGEESLHNFVYWRYQDYIGIGPGAHGRRKGVATQRHKRPEGWLAQVEQQGHGLEAEQALDAMIRAREALLMGLRLDEGIDAHWFAARTGVALADAIDVDAAAHLRDIDLIAWNGSKLRATSVGMLVLNSIIQALSLSPPLQGRGGGGVFQ